MNPFLLLLLEAGINLARTHVSNSAGGEVLDTTSFILDAAQALDQLHQEENGQPLDWSTISHHQPLGPPGTPAPEENPTDPGPIPETPGE